MFLCARGLYAELADHLCVMALAELAAQVDTISVAAPCAAQVDTLFCGGFLCCAGGHAFREGSLRCAGGHASCDGSLCCAGGHVLCDSPQHGSHEGPESEVQRHRAWSGMAPGQGELHIVGSTWLGLRCGMYRSWQR